MNAWGVPLPEPLRDVNPKHLDAEGPAHPDPAVEAEIIIWALGASRGEPLSLNLRAEASRRASGRE